MPSDIQKFRDAAQKVAGAGVGLALGQSFSQAANQQSRGFEAEHLALPMDVTNWQTLQDLDPASPTFGLFYFQVDYDTPGDSTKIIR